VVLTLEVDEDGIGASEDDVCQPACESRVSSGNLIGINTAMLRPMGGNVGIGFAIPINMARAILVQLNRTANPTSKWAPYK
jgi:hypothetical protein